MILPRFLAILMATGVLVAGTLRPGLLDPAGALLTDALSGPLLQGALCVLLFTAALHLRPRGPVRTLAYASLLTLASTALSILIIAFVSRWVFTRLGLEVPLLYCLLFGALIAPADPLAMLRALVLGGAPPGLGRRIAGESFLASVIGLVCFGVLLARASGDAGGASVPALLVQQAGGGVLLGLCLGLLMLYVLRHDGRAAVALPLSLGAVLASWALGQALGLSGPVAAGAAGLLLSMQGDEAFGERDVRDRLAAAWLPCSEVVTALLLIWLAVELAAAGIAAQHLGAAVFVLPVVVVVRAVIVGAALWLYGRRRTWPEELAKTVGWGGVRGGLAAALALSLPPGIEADPVLTATFVVLAFSLILQAPAHGLALASSRPLSEQPPRAAD